MPKVVDHARLRSRIVARCLEIGAERGLAAMPMREIARLLGTSTGLLYHYFPGKDALVASLFEALARLDLTRALGPLPRGATLARRLERLFEFASGHFPDLLGVLLVALDYRRAARPVTTQDRGARPSGPTGRPMSAGRRAHPASTRGATACAARSYRQAIAKLLGVEDPSCAAPVLSLIAGMLLQRYIDPRGFSPARHRSAIAGLAGSLGRRPRSGVTSRTASSRAGGAGSRSRRSSPA